MRAVLAVLLVLTAPFAAIPTLAAPTATTAPETSPRPQARPQGAPVAQAAPAIAPKARSAPEVSGGVSPAPGPDRSPRPERRPSSSATVGIPAPVPAGALCGVAGLTGRRLPAVASATSGCGIVDPVEITAVQGVRLSMPLTMDCVAAKALNEWVRVVLQPTFTDRVRRLDVAGAYVCRGRNNQRGAKVSEHGRGRAVDVSGLTFTDGSSVTVAGDWNKGRDGQLMTRAYKAGCGIFGTTLGPGSDGYHEDHMHFDVPSNRRSPYCR